MRFEWTRIAAVWVGAALVVAGAPDPASAGWIWTPESGRWVNPNNQPKESASLQFQHAESLLEKGEYDEAVREFERVLEHFPTSSYGDLAQFSIGRAHEGAGAWDLAAEAYQKTIDQYPGTRLFERVITKQYELGNKYYERAMKIAAERRLMPNWREFFGGDNDFDRAIGVYQRVVDNQPFTESAAEAQYRIGLCYMQQEEWELAGAAYDEVQDMYPTSPWAGEAAFSAAEAQFRQSLPAVYDQTAVDNAMERFEYYLRHYGDATRREQIEGMMAELRDRRAEHEFRIAEWYHRNYKFESARLYYREVITGYADTEWAALSRQQLAQLP